MGLSPYPHPADGGVICIIVVGTAISITMVKEFFLSLLHMAGLRSSPSDQNTSDAPPEIYIHRLMPPTKSYMEKFRKRTPAVKFHSLSHFPHLERECSVCITEFENNNEINHLSCGHIFHKVCLEKWLNYRNVTCPLCRTLMVPREMERDFGY